MKLFFYDLETTGTKFWRNGIHQISGIIVIDNQIKETFNFKVKPFERAEIEEEALKIGGITKDDLITYESMNEVYGKILSILAKYVDKFDKKDKFHLVGYNNASFDNQFFRAFFVQCNDNYFGSWFWSDSIDVMVLASNYLMEDRAKMADFKLKTVAAYLGIEVDENKLHDALYDIELTKKIYEIVS
jgi:DNA polymerase III subunit epsilon